MAHHMQTFIALLRGINVGKANRIPMAELRALLAELGHEDVSTILNSGNAVFRASRGNSAAHAQAITSAILERFALQIPVVVKSQKELNDIIQGNPIDTALADHTRLLVAFVQAPDALSSLDGIASLATPPERFIIGQHAAYLHCASGILESKAAKALLGKAGKACTTRNWATVLKLQHQADTNS